MALSASTIGNYIMVSYLCKDGVLRSFNDPLAVRERAEALSHIKGNYRVTEEEWAEAFSEKEPKWR